MFRRPLAGVTILVVDDHDETRETLAESLKTGGARVLSAHSAQAALLTLEQERPDLLLTDLEMPEVDGWELMLRVRALPPEGGGRTPGIALSAHNTHEDRAKSLKAGFRLHLAKPFDPRELVDLLAAMLALEERDPEKRG